LAAASLALQSHKQAKSVPTLAQISALPLLYIAAAVAAPAGTVRVAARFVAVNA